METKTTNYNLIKPDPADFFDIHDFNVNADIIDTEIQNRVSEMNTHINTTNQGETGIHGMRYYQNKLQYKDGANWVDITTNENSGNNTTVSSGTFSPVLKTMYTNTVIMNAPPRGLYIRVGQMVYIEIFITVSNSWYMPQSIVGLPFVNGQDSSLFGVWTNCTMSGSGGACNAIIAEAKASSSEITLMGIRTNTGNIDYISLSNGPGLYMRIFGAYKTTAQ